MMNKEMSEISKIIIHNGWGYSMDTISGILNILIPTIGYVEIDSNTEVDILSNDEVAIILDDGVKLILSKIEDDNDLDDEK